MRAVGFLVATAKRCEIEVDRLVSLVKSIVKLLAWRRRSPQDAFEPYR
jgi:hypothetical protein